VKATIFYYPDEVTLLYSLSPIITSRYAGEFRYVRDPERVLRSRGRTIILFRLYKRFGELDPIDFLRRIRQHYDRIVYFDDTADPREIRTEIIDLVDLYYKKQLLADRALYRREAYGKRLFTQYYHERYKAEDDDASVAPPIGDAGLARLRLSWNLGIGSYPKEKFRRAACTRLERLGLIRLMKFFYADPLSYASRAKEVLKVSARFGASFTRRTVAIHRELFGAAADQRPDLFLRGRIPLAQYNRELRGAAATLSPFGWGEICFRDFEAIISRSVLLKPSMEHIETWPDVYRANETYVPLSWDASDLIAATEGVMGDAQKRERMAAAARDVYDDAVRSTEERVRTFLSAALA
jgi:hypothetical protein